MMLDADQSTPSRSERVAGGQVVRVEVVRHQLGLDREQALEMLDSLGERAQGLVVLQVADVVADPGAGALRKAEGVLQLRTAAEQSASAPRRPGPRSSARSRAIAAAASARTAAPGRSSAARSRRCACGSDDRGEGTGPRSRQACRGRRRRGRRSARRRHCRRSSPEWFADVRQQQMVQRGVGEHHAEVARVRGDRGRDLGRRRAGGRSRSGARDPRAAPPRRRSARPAPAAPARLGAINANGLSSRCLRERSAPTAASSSARQAR